VPPSVAYIMRIACLSASVMVALHLDAGFVGGERELLIR
jgi:hypothetical protein